MQHLTPLTPTSEFITQYNRSKLLSRVVGASAPPSLVIATPQQPLEYAPLYGDILKGLTRIGARVNQVAVIVVAAALITSLVQQYGPGALLWIRRNMSKFCYMLAYRLQIKEPIKLSIIDSKPL